MYYSSNTCQLLMIMMFEKRTRQSRWRAIAGFFFQTSLSSTDFPGFNDTVDRNLGNPLPLLRFRQEFLCWFRFFQSGNDQTSSSQIAELPGQRAVIGTRVDGL